MACKTNQLMIKNSRSFCFTGHLLPEYRYGGPDVALIESVTYMMVQGVKNFVISRAMPRVYDLKGLPVESANTSVAVPPGHARTMCEFLDSL